MGTSHRINAPREHRGPVCIRVVNKKKGKDTIEKKNTSDREKPWETSVGAKDPPPFHKH